MPIPDQVIDEVRNRVSIAEVIGRYVHLTRAGTALKGLCPFHEEKTPSFHVNEARGSWHCFGSCNEGGNVFTFLMKKENRSFPEVVEDLAATVGVEIPKTPLSPAQRQAKSESEEMLAANESAKAFFQGALAARNPLAERARAYLVKRRMTPELIEEFGIGFCGPGWDALAQSWQKDRKSLPLGEKAGLFTRRRQSQGFYDRFHDRIVFPVTNPRGRVIGFGGRALEGAETIGPDSPKYLNSSESPVYKKGEALYGLESARKAIAKSERVVIVEGYFDLLGLAGAGIREVVATCGTALTPSHLTALRRLQPQAVVVLYDGDQAGRTAAKRALPLFLEAGLPARYLSLPEGKDPDDWVAEVGSEAARRALDTAPPLVAFYLGELAGKARGMSMEERAGLLRRVAPVFSRVPPGVELAEYGHHLAEALELPEEPVLRALAGKPAPAPERPRWRPDFPKDRGRFRRDLPPPGPPSGDLAPEQRLATAAKAERNSEETLLRLMLGSRKVAVTVRADRVLDLFRDALLRSLGTKVAEAVARGQEEGREADVSDQPNVAALQDQIRETLSEPERRLLSRLAAEPHPQEGPETLWKDFQGALAKLEQRSLKEKKKSLQSQIRAAQGNPERQDVLLSESRDIDRRLAHLRPGSKAPGNR